MNNWLSYNELAWTDRVLTPVDEILEETRFLVQLLAQESAPNSVLHLGCGAGMLDNALKKEFELTGIDISPGMLDIARRQNPEVRYIHGDMRDFNCNRLFDAVLIPDSIAYITSEPDLQRVMKQSARHLNTNGTLLIVAHTLEEFRNNNFVYTGSEGDTEVTVFENNYKIELNGDNYGYEATLVYLIRQNGDLKIHHDRHTLGLFPEQTWHNILSDSGFRVRTSRHDSAYDVYLQNGGQYPLTVFVGTKKD